MMVFNIRTKVILGIIFFTLVLFGLVQYQNNSKVKKQLVESEIAKNTLLTDTVVPILAVNLSFGLEEANAQYLDSIAAKNGNVVAITLRNAANETIYAYRCDCATPDLIASQCLVASPDELTEHSSIRRDLKDELTQESVGEVEFLFSNLYYEKFMEEHHNFTLKFSLVIVFFLMLFVLFLNHWFAPLKVLLDHVKEFEPKKNNFPLETTQSQNEVGIIQNAIVEMIERIRTYTQQLDDLTKHLEQKVEERTEALRDQRDELERINQALAYSIDEVKAQEKMLISQSRLAAMGEMMSMIAHQWRQPLSTTTLMISNYTIKAMMEGREPDERDKILEEISNTLIYLSETIDHFQTYFRPEKMTEETTLCHIIEQALQFTRARLDIDQVEVSSDCDPEIRVEAYVNEFVQVIINIINNAADAMLETRPEQKKIILQVKKEDGKTILSICDTGGGIPDDVIGHIFEPYFSTKSKNGTGLGLYMAKMIVEKHTGGNITAYNTAQGACFDITLPNM